jgi:hypothetical protein
VPDKAVRRWAGNGYLPGRFGLWGVSGLVVLEVSRSQVTVRLRPKFLARLMGVVPLTAEPGSGLIISVSKGMRPWGWYIEFQLPDERRYSFQVGAIRKGEVLSCLADAGFEVKTSNLGRASLDAGFGRRSQDGATGIGPSGSSGYTAPTTSPSAGRRPGV